MSKHKTVRYHDENYEYIESLRKERYTFTEVVNHLIGVCRNHYGKKVGLK